MRALYVCILRSPLIKKICMEVSWKVGFPLYWYDNWNIRKTKLRPIQKHDVIYVTSNEGYLNCWRDQEDQLQM